MDVDEGLRAASAGLATRLDPDPPSIRDVAHRRRRRRVVRIVVTLVMLAVVGGLAITRAHSDENTLRVTSSSTSTSTTTAGAGPLIPWTDHPVSIATTIPPSQTIPAASCTASQLHVDQVGSEPGAGSVYDHITLTNVSRRTCSISSDVSAVARGSGVPRVDVTSEPTNVDNSDIRPGTAGELTFQTSHTCDAAQSLTAPDSAYTSLGILLDGPRGGVSDSLTVAIPPLPGLCGPPYLESAGPAPSTAPTTTVPDPPAVKLQGRIRDLGSVRPGGVLHYVVALTNTGNQAVRLSPCPSYYEKIGPFLGDTPQTAVPTYQLNCAIASIAPGATVRFAMELAIPATIPPGPENLEWGWLPPLAAQPPPPQATFVITR